MSLQFFSRFLHPLFFLKFYFLPIIYNIFRFHEMNQAEQFILVITKIDRLVARLDTMIFRKKFKDEITDLVPDLRLVKKACNEIKNSPKFAKILEYILMMGNVMNAGTNNAGSYGFNLEFLTKLEDTKGVSDHSTTVLNFLVTTLEKHDAELLKFARELESVSGASRVSYADLKQRIRSIQTSIEDIRAELKHYKSVAKDHNDLYGEVCYGDIVTLINNRNDGFSRSTFLLCKYSLLRS